MTAATTRPRPRSSAADTLVAAIQARVAAHIEPHERVLLAVSGGVDSMVLLRAAAQSVPGAVAGVATFDHATGSHGPAAVATVRAVAARLELPFFSERAPEAGRSLSEAQLRSARWEFLRTTAKSFGAVVATAHTRDDQIETVVMRVLRGAGARGLAALKAPGSVLRPLLEFTRPEIESYARQMRLDWIQDPSNVSRQYFRNRVRLDILPALRAARPSLPDDLQRIAERAARWREDLALLVDSVFALRRSSPGGTTFPGAASTDTSGTGGSGSLYVAASELRGYSRDELAILWPEIAARAGAIMDRRGTLRVAEFTITGRVGGRVQIAGGWEIEKRAEEFVLRRGSDDLPVDPQLLDGELRFARFLFRPVDEQPPDSPWIAALPRGEPLAVRRWLPGDRIVITGRGSPRRVKRFLSEAGVAGADRRTWPVVVSGDRILWIPGVCRADAATDRPGRPSVWYRCEQLD